MKVWKKTFDLFESASSKAKSSMVISITEEDFKTIQQEIGQSLTSERSDTPINICRYVTIQSRHAYFRAIVGLIDQKNGHRGMETYSGSEQISICVYPTGSCTSADILDSHFSPSLLTLDKFFNTAHEVSHA